MMSWDRRIVILFVSLLLFGGFICAAGGYNIALHAQLFPGDGKVVGSVLTTDGLRSAFALRYDVDRVDVFYPSNYKGFLDHEWDLILVEGWFPTIETFVLIARSNFPLSRIVFLCLDPVYPGLDIVKKFDVDAIISNSKVLVEEFRHDFPTDFMLLAANPDEMKPLTNVSRVWGAVYVGAGGQMLQFKPELRQLLIDSIPFGLRLHGSSWESATAGPLLGDIAQGSLPRYDLASAYASAHAVLASTIQSQAAFDMINNRIFEALSCGAVVITHAHLSSALESLHCDAILFVNETHSVAHHLAALTTKLDGNVQEGGGRDCGVQAQVDSDAAHTDAGTAASTGTGTRASRTSVCPRMPTTFGSSSYADNLRHVARNFILRSHTWSHRAVQILDFYHSLVNANPASSHPSLLSSTTTTTTTIPTTTSSSSSNSSSSSSSVASTDTRKPDRGRRRRQNAPRMLIVVSAHLAGHADYIFVVSRAIRHLQQLYRVDLAQYFSAAEGDTSYADAATDFEIVKLCGGRSVAGTLLTSACQSYLQQYDLLLSVVTPFDALDVFMQQLPPVRMRRHLRSATVNATSAQLMQKRAAYIIGFDAALLSSRSSSGGGGGGGGCCACWGGGGGYDTGTRFQHHRHSSRHSSSSRSYSSNSAASSGSLTGGAKLNLSDGASAMVSIVDPRLRQFCNDSVSVDPDVNVMQDTLLKILRIQCSKFDSKTGKIKPPDDPKYKAVFARFTYNKFKHTRCRTLEAAIPHNILHDALLAELNETFTEKMTE